MNKHQILWRDGGRSMNKNQTQNAHTEITGVINRYTTQKCSTTNAIYDSHFDVSLVEIGLVWFEEEGVEKSAPLWGNPRCLGNPAMWICPAVLKGLVTMIVYSKIQSENAKTHYHAFFWQIAEICIFLLLGQNRPFMHRRKILNFPWVEVKAIPINFTVA